VSPEPLDALLDKLTTGDPVAAEQVFRAYEPYLRMVVRRQLSPELRAKFDSMDVVQSVWVHMLRGFREAGCRFADAAHLRAFLVQLTRHRFIDRFRRYRRALESERPLAEGDIEDLLCSHEPQPADLLQADELWERMLGLCPPAHREVLRLKREGLSNAEIAARAGLHEGSVRRILQELSLRLARFRKDDRPPSRSSP
jgi:RNA polymerase sigma-70 factor (ECF subfamily)